MITEEVRQTALEVTDRLTELTTDLYDRIEENPDSTEIGYEEAVLARHFAYRIRGLLNGKLTADEVHHQVDLVEEARTIGDE